MSDLVQPVATRREQQFLECHAEGHQWRHEGIVGAPHWTPPFGMQGAIARHSICTSCGTERARWYVRSGESQLRYRHPEGYLHKRSTPDDFAPSKLDYRQRVVVTLFAELEQRMAEPQKFRRARKSAAS